MKRPLEDRRHFFSQSFDSEKFIVYDEYDEYYSFVFSASAAGLLVAFLLFFGLVFPWLPANILPRRVRLSPFPIFI